MVHCEIVAEHAEASAAEAIEAWANAHPGDENFVVQVRSDNPRVEPPMPSMWPNTVDGSRDALAELGAAIEEHATSYKIEYLEDGRSVYGVACNALHAGHRYIEPDTKPGLATWAQVWAYLHRLLLAPRWSTGQLVAAAVLYVILARITG